VLLLAFSNVNVRQRVAHPVSLAHGAREVDT
jgi:hypothetical protein